MLPGDLALRKVIRNAYQLDHLPNEQEVLAIAEKWRPFRSLATSYLFASASTGTRRKRDPAKSLRRSRPGRQMHALTDD